jgi:hypothetical protein
MQSERMVVTERNRDRFARSAEVTISRFQLSTPYFFTLVKNPDEFRFLIELTNDSPGAHFGGCVVRLFDAHKIVGERIANLNQQTLDMSSNIIEESFIRFRRDHPIIIDPATEYLYYLSNLGKWAKDEQVHPKIREFANRLFKMGKRKKSRTWRKERNLTLWNYDLAKDLNLEHEVISGLFDAELHYGASTLLTPGPLISDISDFETTIEITKLARADAIDKDAEFGNYFILTSDAILDKDLRYKLGDFLASSAVNFNVLKFKYLNLRNAPIESLRAYADFYRRLAEIREQKKGRIFCVLENDCQAFASATVAFDLVSTSMSGYDRYPRGRAKTGFANIFDVRELSHIKHETYKEAYVNNRGNALCSHAPCQNVDPQTALRSAWSAMTKKHYVLSMGDLMEKLSNYAGDHSIEQATQDLINSHMSPLKKLIPTEWESPPVVYPTP